MTQYLQLAGLPPDGDVFTVTTRSASGIAIGMPVHCGERRYRVVRIDGDEVVMEAVDRPICRPWITATVPGAPSTSKTLAHMAAQREFLASLRHRQGW